MKKNIFTIVFILICIIISAEEAVNFWEDCFGYENLYKIKNGYLFVSYMDQYFVYYDDEDIKINEFGYFIWDTKGKTNYINGKQVLIPGERISDNFSGKNFSNSNYSYISNGYYDSNIDKITCSSYLSESINNKRTIYDTKNLFKIFFLADSLEDKLGLWNFSNLPWVEGENENGVESFIGIEFKKTIESLNILNGYVDLNKMKLFYENNRVREMELVDLTNNKIYKLHFENFVYFNNIDFEIPTKHIKIVIKKIYPGTKYNDTCISGMRYQIALPSKTYKDVERVLKEFKEK